jgi:tetratricopeptide (TPR) repeat protein
MRVAMFECFVAVGMLGMLSGAWASDVVTPQKPPLVAEPGMVTLTPQIIYEYLVAEVAIQRGVWPIASEAYLKLAKDTADPRIARRALEVALQARQGGDARQAAGLWLAKEPKSINALHAEIDLLIGSKQPMAALPYLRQMLSSHPGMAGEEFLELGNLLGELPDKSSGDELIRTLAADYPHLPEAHLALAQVDARNARFDLAMKELDVVDTLKPGWDLSAKLHFEVLLKTVPDAAEPFIQSYLKQHADAPEARLAYARFLLKQNRLVEAHDQFALLVQTLPGNAVMQVASGMVSLQMNDLPAAKEAFIHALQLNYDNPGLLELYLGQIAEALKQNDEAADWYLAVKSGEQFIPAQIRYADLLARQGKIDEARARLHAVATESDLERVQLIRAEAEILHNVGQVGTAYKVLGDGLATRPDSVGLLYDHAMLAETLGHLDVAERDLRHLLVLQPNYAQALNALGYIYADHNIHLNEAVGLLRQALILSPNDAFILDSMGWAQYRLGNLPEAETYLNRAYSASQDPEIAAHLGEVLWRQGKFDATKRLWKAALIASPDNAVLQAAAEKFK